MPRPRLAALPFGLLFLLSASPDSPDAMIPGWGVSVGGTVVSSVDGVVLVGFRGAAQPGKFDGTVVTARIWGRTKFDRFLSRSSLPGAGVPVTIILDPKPLADGSYRLNAIRADVR
jgi:hypothetical protein